MLEILPSVLSADFARLGDDIARVSAGPIHMLHLDVMDGHFVPNLSFGVPVVTSIRKVTQLELDVHLMIERPELLVPAFAEAGADSISIHQETCRHLDRSLRQIRDCGCKAGAVLNPSTPVSTLDDVLDIVDFVLIMSVNPGFGGQSFIPRALDKITELAARRRERGLQFAIEVDGGIKEDNVAGIARAGADWFVAGTSVFADPDPAAAAGRLLQLAREATSVRV
jgi:ribulose-phosphate 3-epimerase